MKSILLFFTICLFAVLHTPHLYAQTEEVTYDWTSDVLKWNTEKNISNANVALVPCKRTFKLKIINLPKYANTVQVIVYESIGGMKKKGEDMVQEEKDSVAQRIGEPIDNGKEYYVHIFLSKTTPTKSRSGNIVVTAQTAETELSGLSLNRYYYIEVTPQYTLNTTTEKVEINGTPQKTTTTKNIIENTLPLAGILNNTETSDNNGVITEKTTTINVTPPIGAKTKKVYAKPLSNELSTIEGYFSLGGTLFSNDKIKQIGAEPSLMVGIKVRFKPIFLLADNPFYTKCSRVSIVMATIFNDLKYKKSDIKPSLFNIIPMLGLNCDFNKNLGITVGGLVGRQEYKTPLIERTKLVAGVYVGLSFSLRVFQAFRSAAPSTSGIPDMPE